MIRFSLLLVIALSFAACPLIAAEIKLDVRYQVETSPDSQRFHRLHRSESWKPSETAIIVCDVWDLHHCLNAVRRIEEFGPRLNQVLKKARSQGVTIIHSPSDCMDFYENHPARKRAVDTPVAANLPEDIRSWCSRIPSEERAAYPIDQSDGGEDDDPAEHARWVAKLEALGRNPAMPWKKQSNLIKIDWQADYISDKGDEVWSILEDRGIKNVVLTGVHTNMCVLGRPFGLRQMARNGKNVVLMRDMTDTMYNPKRWPYVSHFTGTDLIVSHIERYVCPTITSTAFLGGEPFRFKNDKRPHLAIIAAEDGYDTKRTLAELTSRYLGRDFRVSYVHASDKQRNLIPGLDVLDEADLAIFSVRRRVLPKDKLDVVRRFVVSGKPVIGIRPASHAFVLRNESPPEGFHDWPKFDEEVFGCHYGGDHGKPIQHTVGLAETAREHPVLTGVDAATFVPGAVVYKSTPLAKETEVLLVAASAGEPDEPLAWTFRRADGGRSFYTSLGHPDDFQQPAFRRMLVNAVYWAAGLQVPEDVSVLADREAYENHWSTVPVPSSWEAASGGVLKDYDGTGWYRCVVRVPGDWLDGTDLRLTFAHHGDEVDAWWNGTPLIDDPSNSDTGQIEPKSIIRDDANLLVIRVKDRGQEGGLQDTPVLHSGDKTLELKGRWQFRIGQDSNYSNMPLPAKFGASTDIVYEPGG